MSRGRLAISDLTVGYGGQTVLSLPELTVEQGEFLSILGPSGCGKTTLLNTIAGFIEPMTGVISLDGSDISGLAPYKRGLGLVFQNYALFPHMTVAGNLAYGLQVQRVPKGERATRIAEALELVGMAEFGDRYPRQLSGGQQQRVALARALVIRPRLLLLDEPLSNLDAKLRRQMRHELREIQQRVGTTMVFVTHDQTEALTMSDRIVLLAGGRLEQLGTPEEIYRSPSTPFVADFVGAANLFSGALDDGVFTTDEGDRLPAEGLGRPASAAALVLRPENVRIAAPDSPAPLPNAVRARVLWVAYGGDSWQLRLATGGGAEFNAHVRDEAYFAAGRPEAGAEIVAGWHSADLVVLERGATA